jgi:hypothetical protein
MALEDYNWADRMVHKLAFGAAAPQAILCDMEARQFGPAIAAQDVGPPVFVTALPRAGTTLLLEVLAKHPSLVSHSYRDMPFVLSPIVWRRLSARFQVRQQAKERSHKDGLMVSVDSPEAFEEVLWLKHFPSHYRTSGIETWERLPDGFVEALRRHMKALDVSRGATVGPDPRYLSKNNANIARLPALASAFPGAQVLVPLRHPLDHAHSLLKQHHRALDSHARSRFTRAYTADIGHFEFGETHRPILFEGMGEVIAHHDPLQPDYWIAYWIAAHRHLERGGAYAFVDMERFTGKPGMAAMFEKLGLAPAPEAAAAGDAMVHPMARYDASGEEGSPLVAEALEIYQRLRKSDACLA